MKNITLTESRTVAALSGLYREASCSADGGTGLACALAEAAQAVHGATVDTECLGALVELYGTFSPHCQVYGARDRALIRASCALGAHRCASVALAGLRGCLGELAVAS